MNIEIINRTKEKTANKKIESLVLAFSKKYHFNFDSLAVVFVGEQRIKSLNRDYRGHDLATDVLSFSPADFPGAGGELIICLSRVFRYRDYQAVFPEKPEWFVKNLKDSSKKKLKEYLLYFVLVHGLLHLVGFNDEREIDRLKMVDLGEKFLHSQGFLLS